MTEPQEITAVWGDPGGSAQATLGHRKRRGAAWQRVLGAALVVGIVWFVWPGVGEQRARGESAWQPPEATPTEYVVPQLVWEFDTTSTSSEPTILPSSVTGGPVAPRPTAAGVGSGPLPTPASSAPASAVAPSVAPFVPISVQAESSGNLLLGGAKPIDCATCRGGQRVGYIGPGAALVVRLTLPAAGPRVVTVVYEADGTRQLRMSANGSVVLFAPVTGPDWQTPQTLQITLTLPAGAVELTFDGDLAPTPDIDLVTIG